jgi:hypothetical protein
MSRQATTVIPTRRGGVRQELLPDRRRRPTVDPDDPDQGLMFDGRLAET